jgi:hypothetical protein
MRTAATQLVGGADAADLGITGDFTAYVVLQTTQTTQQYVVDRGMINPTDPGWSIQLYTDTTGVTQAPLLVAC